VGDSITREQLSTDHLALLAVRRPPGALALRRFAANGGVAYSLAQRLDEVVATPADVIAVLIGSNDARARLPGYPVEKSVSRKKVSRKQLPERTTAAWYRAQPQAVVSWL